MAWLDARNSSSATHLAAALRDGAAHVRKNDLVVAKLVDHFGPVDLRATRSPYQVMLETIVSQQLSTHAARAIYGRLSAAAGGRVPKPTTVLALSDHELIECGLSRSKVAYVRNVSSAFAEGGFERRKFARHDDDAVAKALTSIKGVGPWSAHMFLIFALHRLDVFPIGDLGLRNAMAAQYGLRRNTPERRYHAIAESWRPYRTVATLYLWRSYDGL